MTAATLHRWQPGDPKLTGVQVDANFGTLEQRIQEVVITSGGLVGIANNADGTGVVLTLADGRTWTVAVAAPIWGEPTMRVVGTAYKARDTFIFKDPTGKESTYYVKANHVATASLDAVATEQIKNSLDAVKESRTVVVISHSISQIVDSDVIFVLKQGRVVESGTHEELYEMGGTYSEIFNASARSLNLDRIYKTLDADEAPAL